MKEKPDICRVRERGSFAVRRVATRLGEHLRNKADDDGDLWWDRGINPGGDAYENMRQAYSLSKCILLLLSPNALPKIKGSEGSWLRDEVSHGQEFGKLIAARIYPMKKPATLADYKAPTLFGEDGEWSPKHWKKLIKKVDAQIRLFHSSDKRYG